MEQRVEEQLQRFQRMKASVHEAVRIPKIGFCPSLPSNMLPSASPPAPPTKLPPHGRDATCHHATSACVLPFSTLCGLMASLLFTQVFESLRGAPHDPFAAAVENDTTVRSILASHLTHGSATGGINSKASRPRQPEFSHRLATGPVRYNPMLSRLKVTMGSEATYNSFREALSLAETVRTGEEMAARLRIGALRRQQKRGGEASSDPKTLSDAAYDAEIEEAKVRRQVHAMSQVSAETQKKCHHQEQVAKHEENLAFFAAISLQPAVRAVIEAALDDEWLVGDGGSETEMVTKRLNEAKGLNSRELYIAQVRPQSPRDLEPEVQPLAVVNFLNSRGPYLRRPGANHGNLEPWSSGPIS